MTPSIFKSIVLIGAGNVGYHLGRQLHTANQPLCQVFSRKKRKAQRLAKLTGSSYTTDLAAINPRASLYLLAVSDDAIGPVAAALAEQIEGAPLVVHTSGATPSTVLKPFCKRFGIFYPLQTFSLNREAAFSDVPVCIFANRKADRQRLLRLGGLLSQKVVELDDVQRARLHVAAVFANNFTNYLYSAAQQILVAEGLNFDLLKPLIRETAAKIEQASPRAMQTGPARRGDRATIERHLAYLEAFPELRSLYEQLSDLIGEDS